MLSNRLLELQSALASGVSQGLDAPVIHAATAVERDLGDADFLRPGSDRLADLHRGCDVAAVLQFAADIALDARHGCEGLASEVVNKLRVNVLVRAEDAEPRPLGSAEDVLAGAEAPTLESCGFVFVLVCHICSTFCDVDDVRRCS